MASPALKDFRELRRWRALERLLVVVLFVSLALMLNGLGAWQVARKDLTEERRYALSAETLAYIDQITEPVTIYLTHAGEAATEPENIVAGDLSLLLREYAHAARRKGTALIEVKKVDIFRQRELAESLVRSYGVDAQKRNALIVTQGGRYQEIDGAWLYDTDELGNHQFVGERAITSALLTVTQKTRPIVYSMIGHGESRLADTDPLRGFSMAADFLNQRGWDVRPLELKASGGIPEDSDLLIIPSPQVKLLPVEVRLIRDYLNRDGRVLILLGPGRQHNFEPLFFEWGLMADDAVVIETADSAIVPGGDILISSYGEHPITEYFYRNQLKTLVGLCRPVRPDLGAPATGLLDAAVLLATSPKSWGSATLKGRLNRSSTPAVILRAPSPSPWPWLGQAKVTLV